MKTNREVSLAEFKRIRWKIALIMHIRPQKVIIDELNISGKFRKVRVYVLGVFYIVYMSGDVVTQVCMDVDAL